MQQKLCRQQIAAHLTCQGKECRHWVLQGCQRCKSYSTCSQRAVDGQADLLPQHTKIACSRTVTDLW